MATVKEVARSLERFAPLHLQESYDNSGLIVGNPDQEVTGVLLCLDSIEEVIEEAISLKCNMVVAHHPIVFKGLRSITGKNYVERTLLKAIKNDIAIYACHTNADNVKHGVNAKIAEKLGLKELRVLAPKTGMLKKLVFFVPLEACEKVREAIFNAGGGSIGDYDMCSFNADGYGTFRAGANTNPYVGKKGELHKEPESRVEVIFEGYLQNKVISALIEAHPYEEVAYDIYNLDNLHAEVGSGMLGSLPQALDEEAFLKLVKSGLKAKVLRHTQLLGKKIEKVAICGGSGSFLLNSAISAGADAFISADFKYHEFFDADKKLLIADVGHYESEQFTVELFSEHFKVNFPTFAVHFSQINTNPINYL